MLVGFAEHPLKRPDLGDAYMLADILRTDGHRFRPLTLCSDDIKVLRKLIRGRDADG